VTPASGSGCSVEVWRFMDRLRNFWLVAVSIAVRPE
jgi:hypothetical protein